MPQRLKVAWMGLAAVAGTLLCSAPSPGAAQSAAPAAAPTPELPFTHGRIADGATKSAVCSACHGPNGNSANPEWPRLAGQSPVYIPEQLRLFRAEVRTTPVIHPPPATWTNQDIDDPASTYEPKTRTGPTP